MGEARIGIPERNGPWQSVAVNVGFTKLPVQPGEGQFYAMLLDTPDVRSVTFWPERDLEGLARNILDMLGAEASPRLVIADASALGQLPANGRSS